MRRILHIRLSDNQDLAEQCLARQRATAENEIRSLDLRQTEPDYDQLLEEIFRADSIEVW